eukprot:NODE_469_length_7049_cov_0.468489.p3 type:complete len:327 gc:universal NODE_469_length_7049_cov_0.468489:5229-4249(-)
MKQVFIPNHKLTLNYWTSREISANDKFILIFHALTGNCEVNEWWDLPKNLPGFCCICFTLPSSPYNTIQCNYDISQECHIIYEALKILSIPKITATIGGSLGGFYSLQFSQNYSAYVENCVVLASAPCASDWLLCWNEVQRQALFLPNGLALARMIAMLSYRSPQAFDKFQKSICQNRLHKISQEGSPVDLCCKEDIESACEDSCQEVPLETPSSDYLTSPHSLSYSSISYIHYQAFKFTSRFKKQEYLNLLKNMDEFSLTGNLSLPILSISFSSDILFPPHHVEASQKYSSHFKSGHFNIETDLGHDAFLVETNKFIKIILSFIA